MNHALVLRYFFHDTDFHSASWKRESTGRATGKSVCVFIVVCISLCSLYFCVVSFCCFVVLCCAFCCCFVYVCSFVFCVVLLLHCFVFFCFRDLPQPRTVDLRIQGREQSRESKQSQIKPSTAEQSKPIKTAGQTTTRSQITPRRRTWVSRTCQVHLRTQAENL